MQKLTSPTGRDIELKPVHPNVGVEAGFRRALLKLLREVHEDISSAVLAAYRVDPPATATDADPQFGTFWSSSAWNLQKIFKAKIAAWQGRLETLPGLMAKAFMGSAAGHANRATMSALKSAGFTVRFQMSPVERDAIQGSINEQVGLIRSLAEKHLSDVQGMVMRSVVAGRDVGGLAEELRTRYDISARRAAFIARDQNNKATATITRARQDEFGLQARWAHSGSGRHPRREHVLADGTVYDPAEGCLIGGKRIWPGQEPNCGCISLSIIPGAGREGRYRGMSEKMRTASLARSRSITRKRAA